MMLAISIITPVYNVIQFWGKYNYELPSADTLYIGNCGGNLWGYAMWFGCYNLTRDSEIVMEAGNNAYNPLVEFYTSSERTLECYNQTKRKLIEMYCEGK